MFLLRKLALSSHLLGAKFKHLAVISPTPSCHAGLARPAILFRGGEGGEYWDLPGHKASKHLTEDLGEVKDVPV